MSGERVAVYCRLSQEDRDKLHPEEESRSIRNQKELLCQYSKEQGWHLTEIYSDEDYAGSDRDRPAFRRLLQDAKAGKFDIILCKTQSRFTRELELVEKYINGLFPEWGIRFVSVADHVDTARKEGKKARQINGLINEWYLEDLSDSIKAVLHDHQRQGRHIGSFAPYGYRKDPEKAGHLLLDEEAAATVREIFTLYEKGMGKTAIAKKLNQEKIPNPSSYKQKNGSTYRCKYGEQNSGLWRYSTVSSILSNPVYIGSVVQHRYEKCSYKSSRVRSVPREDWIVVEHCHEPVIPEKQWEQVQQLLKSRTRPAFGRTKGIFAGKLRCLFCGKTLRRCKSNGERYYFKCSGAQLHSGCPGGFIPYQELCDLVWQAFSEEMRLYLEEDPLQDWWKTHCPQGNKERIREKLKQNEAARKALYWDKLQEKVTDDWFRDFSAALEMERRQLEEQIQQPEQEIKLPKGLSKELVSIFIESISVGKRDPTTKQVPVVIQWRF